MGVVAVMQVMTQPMEKYFRHHGWIVARNPPPGWSPLMVCDRVDERILHDALQQPWAGCLETDGMSYLPLGDSLQRHLTEGGIGVVLRTDTAYGLPLAQLFTEALQTRLFSADTDISEVEFVIHEMLANAMLHGNFGIHSGMTGNLDAFMAFGASVETALATPELASRRVQLSASLTGSRLEIAVEDDGAGFDSQRIPHDSLRPHGLELVRGMAREMRVEEKGRRTMVVFHVRPRQKVRVMTDLSAARVLVVDDKEANRALLSSLLQAIGVGQVDEAANGQQGLDQIVDHKPDLVILDVMMPVMDGLEMCRRLRKIHPLSDLPVLFITALEGPSDRFACFAAGGSDVVAKPFNNAEVIARVGVHLQLGLMMDQLRQYQDRVFDELQYARQAQMSLAPTQEQIAAICDRTGLRIEGLMETSSELGGDFWTIVNVGRRQICILMADFTGHGTAAAFNVFRLHLLLSRLPRQTPSPAQLMEYLNGEMRAVMKPGQFASMFLALLDVDAGTLTYASAASPPPVIEIDGQIRFLESAGVPLGAFDEPEYEEATIAFPPGSRMLIYSDAFNESERDGKLVCDEETLLRWFGDIAPGEAMTAEILSRFHKILPGDPPDDLTLVYVRNPIEGECGSGAAA